jgi:hypothetical protein
MDWGTVYRPGRGRHECESRGRSEGSGARAGRAEHVQYYQV